MRNIPVKGNFGDTYMLTEEEYAHFQTIGQIPQSVLEDVIVLKGELIKNLEKINDNLEVTIKTQTSYIKIVLNELIEPEE